MSISKAQASAIADGFLDGLGSSKDELQPRETFSEIVLIAGEMVEDMQNNLIKNKSVASGKLSASISAQDPEQKGNILSVDIVMAEYGLYVNKGVKGTKGSRGGNSPYKFKYDKPSKKMVSAIDDWIKGGKARITNTNTKKTISKNERKNASISEISSAYAVARSIVQKGLKPTGFLDRAVKTADVKVRDRLGAALQIDIVTMLKG